MNPNFQTSSELFKASFFILWFLMVFAVNSTSQWNSEIIVISIGLLTFVAVFYSLVVKRDFEAKRDNLLSTNWNENIENFEELLEKIKNEAKSDRREHKKLVAYSFELNKLLESISSFESETDINKSLVTSSLFFLISIALFFFDNVTGFIFPFAGSIYTARIVGFSAFWLSFYHTIKLLNIWFLVVLRK